jgi:hypothetical protein
MGKIATVLAWDDSTFEARGALSAGESMPLPQLLVHGGDDRLAIDPVTGLNAYGCSPLPRPGVLAFSSSTASSISGPSYRRVKLAKDGYAADLAGRSAAEAFDLRLESARRAVKTCLGINACEVVFSASGTDAQLHAHFFARMTLGAPLTTIVVASDQTGSGTVHTSRGRHFSSVTALGHVVTKGAAIDASGDDTSIGIALIRQDGSIRPAAEIDAEVMNAVGGEIAAGRKVLLQIMEGSKLGWRAPSDACVAAVTERWPHSVQVVVDACQLRLGRTRLKRFLERGAMVLITGSKFFMGPGFSGATLVPRILSDRLAGLGAPAGGAQYMSRFDLPPQWTELRDSLAPCINLGAWLRWEAALEEMGAYYAVPRPFASALFPRAGQALASIISATPALELLREEGGCPRDDADDELPAATVFAFFVKGRDGYLPHEDLVRLYRRLNQDVANALPPQASAAERRLAAQPCHIGQPVKFGGRSVLRLALGARLASEAWSEVPRTAEHNMQNIVKHCATVADKIDLLVHYGLAGK